jgi:hypothetical protein
MKTILNQIADHYQIKITQVKSGDKHCQANGEINYINNSYVAGNIVYLGIYQNKELALISVFHEIGHILLPKKMRNIKISTLLKEIECWNIGIKEATKFGIIFSDKAIKWGYQKGLSYTNHDEKETRNWKNTYAKQLWINK